jgi:PAS domain-containing protein
LVALGVGMAASGTVLLSAVPAAAFIYMSGILIPSAVKCLVFLNQKGYVLLGVLAVSYWWFLAALIAKITREIRERKQADVALKESEVRLQAALMAGQVVAFTWDPRTGLSQRSENAPQILGVELQGGTDRGRNEFLTRVHPEDRTASPRRSRASVRAPVLILVSFSLHPTDGQEVWLEETGSSMETAGIYRA